MQNCPVKARMNIIFSGMPVTQTGHGIFNGSENTRNNLK